jgi:hypothetical protein
VRKVVHLRHLWPSWPDRKNILVSSWLFCDGQCKDSQPWKCHSGQAYAMGDHCWWSPTSYPCSVSSYLQSRAESDWTSVSYPSLLDSLFSLQNCWSLQQGFPTQGLTGHEWNVLCLNCSLCSLRPLSSSTTNRLCGLISCNMQDHLNVSNGSWMGSNVGSHVYTVN